MPVGYINFGEPKLTAFKGKQGFVRMYQRLWIIRVPDNKLTVSLGSETPLYHLYLFHLALPHTSSRYDHSCTYTPPLLYER